MFGKQARCLDFFAELREKLRENALESSQLHAGCFISSADRRGLAVQIFDSSAAQFEAAEVLDSAVRKLIVEIADDYALLFEDVDLQKLRSKHSHDQGLRFTDWSQDSAESEFGLQAFFPGLLFLKAVSEIVSFLTQI
jgi:hypothetical protein